MNFQPTIIESLVIPVLFFWLDHTVRHGLRIPRSSPADLLLVILAFDLVVLANEGLRDKLKEADTLPALPPSYTAAVVLVSVFILWFDVLKHVDSFEAEPKRLDPDVQGFQRAFARVQATIEARFRAIIMWLLALTLYSLHLWAFFGVPELF